MKKSFSHFIVPFVLFFIFSLLIINWSSISWVFDWEIWQRTREQVDPIPEDEEIGEEAPSAANTLIIPVLGVEAPLRMPDSTEESILMAELDRGVVLYPGVVPGEKGRVIVLGHSAPAGHPDIKFDHIFSNLGNLTAGDKIKIYYNERLFIYSVDRVKTMSVKEYSVFLSELVEDEYALVVSTCYPPGRDWQRWVAVAHLLTE